MSENNNKKDSGKLKNNELFVISPDDDETVERFSGNIDSFEFIMPLDYDDENENDSTRLNGDDDVAVMVPEHNDDLHLDEAVEADDTIKPAKKAKPVKTKSPKSEKAQKEKKPVSTGMFIFTISAKLILICAVVAVLIAAVYTITAPLIAKNESAKKEAALTEIFPEMTAYDILPCDEAGINELYLIKKDDTVIGYCGNASPKGYGGAIGLMIGVNADRSIADIKVLSHAETPGYGANALADIKNSGYLGLNKEAIELGVDVDISSGATRTSKAINNGVNSVLAVYDEYILPLIGQTEPTKELTPEEIEANAVDKAFGWVTEEHRMVKSAITEHTFDEIYCLKTTTPEKGETNDGYAAVVTLENELGSAKLVVTIWFGKLNSIEAIELKGESFAELVDNEELMIEIKRHINGGIDPEGETFSEEGYAVYNKAKEVLEFYPTYLELIAISEEGGEVNE